MSFDFVEKVMCIGPANTSPIQFYKKGFNLNYTGSQPSWQDIILSGNTALTLVNAKANGLNYLKLFGGTEQRNIPAGYTQVEYLESTGSQYINLGYPIDSTMSFNLKSRCISAGFVFGCRESTSSKVSGLNYDSVSNLFGIRIGSSMVYNGSSWTPETNYEFYISNGNTKINGTTVSTAQYGTSYFSGNAYLFTINHNGEPGSAAYSRNRIYYFQMFKNGVLTQNLIPAKRNSDNVLGMYDTVTGNFLTNAGEYSFTAGADVTVPTPDTPINIICNNGVVKANTNLYSTEYHNSILSRVDGIAVIAGADVNVSRMVDCRTIKSFKITTISPQGSFRIFKYGIDNTFIDANSTADVGAIVTFGDNVGFFRIQYNYITVGTENILIYNNAYSLNEIYTEGTQEVVTDSVGNTANAERLLAVGNYKDTQEVLTGSVTRNVGIKVLDGTEDWQFAIGSQFFYADISNLNALESTHTCYCTHFQGKSTDATIASGSNQCKVGWNVGSSVVWNRIYISPDVSLYADVNAIKQYLASQYNAGTPVIIVYPLATPTTESVAGQQLTTQAGTNIVEITQASIDNLGLEVSYKATV